MLLLHCSLGLMKQPTTLPCGHSGCIKCMKEARSIRQCCPKCRDTEVPTFSKNISMDAMVAVVEAKCLAVGCPWKGLFKDAEDNQRKCSCVDHSCRNSDCLFSGQISALRHYLATCPYRTLTCRYCHVEIIAKEEEEHLQLCCAGAPKVCFLGCGKSLPR